MFSTSSSVMLNTKLAAQITKLGQNTTALDTKLEENTTALNTKLFSVTDWCSALWC